MNAAEIFSIFLAGARLLKKPAEGMLSEAAKDAYQKLKGYLQRKFSSSNAVQLALNQAEEKPESEARKAVLAEEAEPFRVADDTDLVALAVQLRDAIGASSFVQQTVHLTQAGSNNSFLMAGRDIVQPQHHTVRSIVEPNESHITHEQKKALKDLVDDLAARLAGNDGKPNYRAAWGRLYDEFRITSYHLLPADDFERAITFLREQKAIARSRLRRRNPQAYRNDFYAKIHASANAMNWSEQQIYEFAEQTLEKRPIRSLRKLGPNQLKKLSEHIFRKADPSHTA